MNNLLSLHKPKQDRAMSKVNLDALIPREDLEIKESDIAITSGVPSIAIDHLKGDLWANNLRKPDFQRETKEWTPEQVYGLIKSFTDGDLIPAIILWKGEGNIFVIDGAHRLSALLAWVKNDFGDRSRSLAYLSDSLTEKEKKLAKETRDLVEKNIGRFDDIEDAAKNKVGANPKHVALGKKLTGLPIVLQWVTGDIKKAEDSFFKINESASPMDKTEKRLLKGRDKPSAIAARAILRSGRGHNYWSKFDDKIQEEIVEKAMLINNWLFKPQLETPAKTWDIPLAGHLNGERTRELVLNIVNFSNGIKIVDKSTVTNKEKFPEESIDADDTGKSTIEYLINTKRMLANLTSPESSSLGLHPAIYFYSLDAKYQVTAFMAFIELFKDYEAKDKYKPFTKIRKNFEEFLWKHKSLINQSQPQWGSGAKGYKNLAKLFNFIIDAFIKNKTENEILDLLDKNEDYNFFKPAAKPITPKFRKKFSGESKSHSFLQAAEKVAMRCPICGGYIHTKSIEIDHKITIEDGGVGSPENGQPTHPYCNSIKKDLIKEGFLQ